MMASDPAVAPGDRRWTRAAKGYVDSPEGQIHYRQIGEGQPIVLLHQVPSSSMMWESVLGPLADRGYRAIAFDLPGYGSSDPPEQEPELRYYARRIEDSTRALRLQRYHLLGHHTGCSVAIQMALDHPERVGALVGYGVPLVSPELAEELASEAAPEYDRDGIELVRFWKVRWGPPSRPQGRRIAIRSTAEVLLAGRHRPEGHRAVGRADHTAMLSQLTRPMLAIAGRQEMLYDESRQAAAFPNIEFRQLGDCGMDAADEAPEELADAVVEFLGSW